MSDSIHTGVEVSVTERSASCSCGQLQVTASGEAVRISVCHCHACQKRSGSVFAAQARFPRERVRLRGRSAQYTRIADSGNRIIFSFCPDCGATVHYHLAHVPEVIAIPVGAFADSAFPAPTFSVYESRRHPWLTITGNVQHSD